MSCPASAVDGRVTTTLRLQCDGKTSDPLLYQCPAVPPACVYWNETQLAWDTAGCRLVKVEDDEVVCKCNRESLTHTSDTGPCHAPT